MKNLLLVMLFAIGTTAFSAGYDPPGFKKTDVQNVHATVLDVDMVADMDAAYQSVSDVEYFGFQSQNCSKIWLETDPKAQFSGNVEKRSCFEPQNVEKMTGDNSRCLSSNVAD